MSHQFPFESGNPDIFTLRTTAQGKPGALPFTPEQLATAPSGDLFGWSQNVGMGWSPENLGGDRPDVAILSTQGGIRRPDGSAVALGYHTGHWEVGLLMEAAAAAVTSGGGIPFAAYCSDPCDGRTNGTKGMLDSLAYRNDAAIVFRRLVRSLPSARAVVGIATCDKGLPAMMMALAGLPDLPAVLVPGGVSLLSEEAEDLGKVQSIGARFAHGELDLQTAAELGCKACGSPGGGCQFLGTAATSQVVGEALGLTLTHAALSPSGAEIWKDLAARSGAMALALSKTGVSTREILSEDSIHNAMVCHAAFGGSTNLILHLPAIAHAAGLRRPTVVDWQQINREVPRLVDSLPNGPHGFATVQVFLAGGVPEVMLHLRELGLLRTDALTVTGRTLGENLEWWENSERRALLREKLLQLDEIEADRVIMSPAEAKRHGLASTVTFPTGQLAPEGSVIKSTAIDLSLIGADGWYRHEGPARVFASEQAAIAAIKSSGSDQIHKGDVIVLAGLGPAGAGMPETYQVTSALRYLPIGKHVALLTDARFSGVSTGACIGHVSPEAFAGGPIGKLRDGDVIRIEIDCEQLAGSIDCVSLSASELAQRERNPLLHHHPDMPADTRLWAALQNASGGSWGGCVYDTNLIESILAQGSAQ
ncbi:MAG: YjhG/YagF family D-xylonate dehydratase [Verrucomicrobiales bacterium]